MATQDVHIDTAPQRGGYVVRRPRATDAIGQSLVSAYSRQPRLPREIEALIGELDRVSG